MGRRKSTVTVVTSMLRNKSRSSTTRRHSANNYTITQSNLVIKTEKVNTLNLDSIQFELYLSSDLL